MPITKVGDKYEISGQEYDTEEKAETAYKALIALKFDVPKEDKPKKSKKKTKKTEEDQDAES